MAIEFARARYISRSTGGSAVRSAAYNGRAAITAERTGELYYFRHRRLRKRVTDTGGMVAVVTSEGAAVFNGYTFGDKNRRAAGAGILSRYWDGDDEDSARAGGSTNAKTPRVILCLGVQPRIASTFFADLDLRDQGIVNRFLITWPASKAGTRQLEFPTKADLATIRRFNDQAVMCLRMAHGVTPRSNDAPVVIGVTGAARQAWHDFALRTERRQAKGEPYEAIPGYAGKAAEEAARIAAIFTLFTDRRADAVGLDAMQAGIALADWYCGEWLRICDLVDPGPEIKQAARLAEWLQATYGGAAKTFTARDVYRAEACGITTREPADQLLKILATHGVIETADPPKPRKEGRPPLVKWRLRVPSLNWFRGAALSEANKRLRRLTELTFTPSADYVAAKAALEGAVQRFNEALKKAWARQDAGEIGPVGEDADVAEASKRMEVAREALHATPDQQYLDEVEKAERDARARNLAAELSRMPNAMNREHPRWRAFCDLLNFELELHGCSGDGTQLDADNPGKLWPQPHPTLWLSRTILDFMDLSVDEIDLSFK